EGCRFPPPALPHAPPSPLCREGHGRRWHALRRVLRGEGASDDGMLCAECSGKDVASAMVQSWGFLTCLQAVLDELLIK
ncbi:Os04g0564300, partial [Oryza sativa Japonica Group]